MNDRSTVALAVAVWLGAWWSPELPAWVVVVAAGLVAVSFLRGNALALVASAALLAGSLGALAWTRLVPPALPMSISSEVKLLSDPTDFRGAVRVDVVVSRIHAEAWARGREAASLRDRLAGERVMMSGRLVRPSQQARARLAMRHIGVRMEVNEVGAWRPGGVVARVTNGARHVLVQGSRTFDRSRRALFTGFVLGDDRGQAEEVAADFRAAGLTHLLVVSGQNVAFVLVLARPLICRLGIRGRWITTMVLLALIIVITRAEPSVLRATAMAAVSATAAQQGRPTSRLRILALAVSLVVLVDPFLVHVIGFQLSVGASLGIVLLAKPIAQRLPGPGVIKELLAVTLAAQVGIAPVAIPAFDGLPLASLPANLLAVPVAAPLMMWGLVGGFAAGILGSPFDRVLHLPTSIMLGWVAGVAKWAAGLDLGRLRLPHAIAIVVIVVSTWVIRRTVPNGHRVGSALHLGMAVAIALVMASPVLTTSNLVLNGVEPSRGADLWRDASGSVVLVIDRAEPQRLIEGLRISGVHRVDLLVVRSDKSGVSEAVGLLRRRIAVRSAIAPKGHKIRGASSLEAPATIEVGDLRVQINPRRATRSVGEDQEVDVLVGSS